ncbi:MAG: restriction endonuclease subunit S, partial [Pirellula sp.]|nr:restriction endonuclease subunit S [Pirellula sp.]
MTPETFIEQFATFAEAPNGVAKLRELILQLAVQGKLVPQDVNDEPASLLLRQIDDEKSRLAKLGKLKSPSQLPRVDERKSPHGWAVVRLGSLIELISGQHLTPEEYNETGEGHPYLTGPADFGERHPVATRWTHADRALARQDDILITVKGAGIGKSNIVATETAFISRQLMAVRPIIVDRDFVHLTLRSGYDQFQRQGVGIAIPGIGREDILHFVVALPPLAEQRRIVLKVDQLLGLCDELAASQAARREARLALVGATLDRLVSRASNLNTSSPSPRFGERGSGGEGQHRSQRRPPHPQPMDVNRLRDHFDRLFDTPTTIPQLRQAILQLAVQGQLVPQDPNDEPVENLQIKAERTKEKWAGPIDEQEVPFQLPPSWIWFRLGDISMLKHGYAFSSAFFTSEPAPFVLTTPGNFYEKGGFRDRESKRKYYSGPVDPEFILKPGDLIIPMTEQAAGLLGSPAFIPDDGRVYIHNQRLGKLSFSESIAPEFVFWFFNCEFFRGELARTCTG